MAAAELIAEEQLAAIQHQQQQAGIKAAHLKAQKHKHKLAEESRHSCTSLDKSTKTGQLAQTDSLAGKHAINIDAVVSLLVHSDLIRHHLSPYICFNLLACFCSLQIYISISAALQGMKPLHVWTPYGTSAPVLWMEAMKVCIGLSSHLAQKVRAQIPIT